MADVISDDEFVKLFQSRVGLRPDGWAGLETLAALDKLAPAKAPVADPVAIPDAYWPMLSKIESGDRPYIQAATSSASGLYQFIKATWIAEGGTWGPTLRPAFGGLKPSVEEQLARVKSFTQKNARYLVSKGIPINKASLYASHFLGVVMAVKIIGSDIKMDAGVIAGEAATKANPSILQDKTVADFLTWLHKKTGDWAR